MPRHPAGLGGGPAGAVALCALLRDTMAAGQARRALHLRLAPLTARLRAEHHRRLLQDALEPLLRPSRARPFRLPNGDLVAVGPEEGTHLGGVADHFAALMGDDLPVAAVLSLLRLPEQAAALLAAAEAVAGPPGDAPDAGTGPQGEGPGRDGRRRSASAEEAVALERALVAANLARFLRCRPVVRAAPGEAAPPLPAWTQWRVAVPDLCAALLATDPSEAPGRLPPPLRGLVERRMLAELSRPEEVRARGPVGLTLGLAALDSAEFHRLDSLLAPARRAQTVIALAAAEVLADPVGFLAARQVLTGRGYRLALEVPDPGALALLPQERLGPGVLARVPFGEALVAAVAAGGGGLPGGWPAADIVLTGADRAVALGWGWEAGITLFQGRLFRG